ncbi:hypothetical protein [Phreatobacter stygius]|uniref:PepSY domain-containing protein n=1 Tax=Phreatobacter stygius TaxID=1940610 RepID=A0A4D7ASB2_9HYPH|nr:hypothetical protein [Phreatobacter stygius]QCI63849.1 hypothetical protein E8M01_06075 [Phreatobacter stygius]
MFRVAPGKAVLLALAGAWLVCVATLAFGEPKNLRGAADPGAARTFAAPTEAVAGPMPAPATPVLLPWPEIAVRLARRGYTVGEPAVQRGPTYLTTGTDSHGRRLRIVIDGRTAEVIGMRTVDASRPSDRPSASAIRPSP